MCCWCDVTKLEFMCESSGPTLLPLLFSSTVGIDGAFSHTFFTLVIFMLRSAIDGEMVFWAVVAE